MASEAIASKCLNDSLKGRVAIITGASRGIGRECALAFARLGCHVVVAAKTVGRRLLHVRCACPDVGVLVYTLLRSAPIFWGLLMEREW